MFSSRATLRKLLSQFGQGCRTKCLAVEALESRCLLSYSVTDLGTLPGGTQNGAQAINDSGSAVGVASTNGIQVSHAFLWSKGVMTDLGTLPGGSISAAEGINNREEVVGFGDFSSVSGNVHAFLYSNGVMTDLGTLGGVFGQSRARAINASGQVVGGSNAPGDPGNLPFHAFLYSKGVMRDLGTLGGPISGANAIDASGEVAGASTTARGATHAFLLTNGVMNDLGTLGGSTSQALGINDSGEVVGVSTTLGDAATDGFVYAGAAMIDVGTLGGTETTAVAINNAGQVVGLSNTATGDRHAFIYSKGVITDLNTQIPADSGWLLQQALSINARGQIIGIGLIEGYTHGFLLDPHPSNSSVAGCVDTAIATRNASLVPSPPNEATQGFILALLELNRPAHQDVLSSPLPQPVRGNHPEPISEVAPRLAASVASEQLYRMVYSTSASSEPSVDFEWAMGISYEEAE
jgi:probable HAF family extracellular repeat protein